MDTGNKRKDAQRDANKPKRMKKVCDYGERCYRRNPAHFWEFSHKHLESILDNYSGTGDYPIPDKYVLERLTIMEQLDVIVEKELYMPWNKVDNPTANRRITDKEKHDSSQNPVTSNTLNDVQARIDQEEKYSKNTATSSKIASSSKNTSDSSKNTAISSKNIASSSQNTSGNSRNTTSSSKNTAISSKNVVSSNMDVEMKNTSVTEYKTAPDYCPIVPPTRRVADFLNVVRLPGNMAAKHTAAAPYYIFYTTITAARETHSQPNSITFLEILDPSLGELKCSLQINFMVEPGWLLAQYYFAGYSAKKLTILYGEDMPELSTISKKKPHIDAHRITMPTPFGTHHTKMMVLCYEDGSLRVVISTANLYIDDWENRTQGLWFSPRCPELPAEAMPHDGDSPTQFKRGLMRYLSHYHLPNLAYYVERVKRCDFSHINVFLVASVPGSHPDQEWGMSRVGAVLRQHCAVPADETGQWPLLAQASSIGSYGAQPKLWLTGDFLHNFIKIKNQPQKLTMPPDVKLIYPSLENVRQSHNGLLGGGCLPYSGSVHSKQSWLRDYLYQWQAKSTHRNRAMPHIKSYTRTSPNNKMAAFYLLTSANASKGAWGSINKGNRNIRLLSYEVGVLFIPRFVINEDFFPLEEDAPNRLPLIYDVPPIKYTDDMSPWVMDYLHQ